MKTSTQDPPLEPPTRRAGHRRVSIALCCMAGCTPLRELSSYSGESGSGAGAGSDTRGAVVESPGEPAPLQDETVGASAGLDAGPTRAPPSVATSDAGEPDDAGSSSPALACDAPGDVTGEAGRCYSFIAEAASWTAASAACVARGGALARIESASEEALLSQNTLGDTWLGLNDRDTEGTLRWDGGGELGAYSNWAAEQPDDFDGTEDCVELLADGRGWNDRPCTDLRVYVCER